ncbi:MAG: tetratricopeptide repeat protein [Planctomycetaceae bacterium]|nr:tetratricopeptide repeat protein [Planctomycetaceae bacterium]
MNCSNAFDTVFPQRHRVASAGSAASPAALTALSLMWVLVTMQQAGAVDQLVRRSDNATFRGEFQAMTNESVTIASANGKAETISVADISSIRFDGAPSLWGQASANEQAGAYDQALTKYQQMLADSGVTDKRIKAELEFLIARTQVRMAQADPQKVTTATDAINKFRDANKSNFRYLEATILQASISPADVAGKLLQEVQASTVKGFQLEAGVRNGRLLLSTGKADDAMAAFDTVIQSSQGDAGAVSALLDAKVGRAECLLAQKDADAAVTALDEVLESAGESQTTILATAWNLKGDSLRLQGKSKDALMAYLHVDLLYAGEPAQHAKSLFYLSQLWAPAGHQNRADDAASRLKNSYGNSSWAGQLGQ